MIELLHRYNPWWEGRYAPEGYIDRACPSGGHGKAFQIRADCAAHGPAQGGQDDPAQTLIRHLIETEGIEPGRIFYMSLDDYLLFGKTIAEVIDEFRKLHRLPFKERVHLFLDEVTCKEDFDIQLKNIHDSQNAKVYASSSSASILRSRKPFLTGRSTVIEVLPMDFDEY